MTLSLERALGQLQLAPTLFQALAAADRWQPEVLPRGQAYLVVVQGGAGMMRTPDASTALHAGQMLVVAADVPVQFIAEASQPDGLQLAHGLLAATLMNGRCVFDFIPMPHCVDLGRSELFVSAVPELLRESAYPVPGSAAIISCLVRRMVTCVLRDAWPESPLLPASDQGPQGQLLQKIVDSMSKDPARPFTLEAMADEAGMSRSAFHSCFTRTYGKTPLAMLRGIRLKKAEELLIYTDLPVKAIAARLGYRSRSYFWQTFKDAYGSDPDSYRGNAHQQQR